MMFFKDVLQYIIFQIIIQKFHPSFSFIPLQNYIYFCIFKKKIAFQRREN